MLKENQKSNSKLNAKNLVKTLLFGKKAEIKVSTDPGLVATCKSRFEQLGPSPRPITFLARKVIGHFKNTLKAGTH